MVNLLVKLFVKDYKNTGDQKVRRRYGFFGGIVGIILNILLFAMKLFAGILSGALSITADAFNNLSDAGSSTVSLLGFKMAGKPADDDHPFGHGRFEYISGLAISAIILVIGFDLAKNSVMRIASPEPAEFSVLIVVILAVSILVKLWMCYMNRTLGRRIDSASMKATAADSLNDVIATGAVLAGLLIGHFFNVNIDAWMGLLVALFIVYSGIMTARDSLSPLLGQAPDPEFVREIEELVLSHECIIGIHDLIIHNYGPGRSMISLHAEVPSDADLITTHDSIDHIEMDVRKRFGCDITIHMDPINTSDELTNSIRKRVDELLRSIDPALTEHDMRVVTGPTHTNIIFEVALPHHIKMSPEQLARRIRHDVHEMDENYFAVVSVEPMYTKDM